MKKRNIALLLSAIFILSAAASAAQAAGHWGDGYCPNNMRQWCERQDNGSFYCTCQCYPGRHSKYCP